MNKFIKINICFMLISLMIFFTGCESQYLGGDRNEKWKKDLSYMQKALPKKHVNLFFKINEKQFNDEIDSLKNSVDKLNDDEIVDGIYKIIASVGDTHTTVYKKAENVYPIQFYYFKEGIYAINTVSKYKEALNSKLVKVNGTDIKKIQEDISSLIVLDNEAMIKKSMPKYLMNPEALHGLKLVPNTENAVFTFENSNGQTFDLNVSSVNTKTFSGSLMINKDDSYPLYMQKSSVNYWYKYFEDKKTLYFKYNKCQEDKEAGDIDEFISNMLKFMDTHPTEKFVIDIRDNGGGSDRYINHIVDWIKGKKINNKNNLFVIVGRGTFSSAIVNAVTLKKETNAAFVGEETGGKPNHYGAVKGFSLPNSKLEIGYSTQFNKTCDDNSSTFMPDKVIEISIKDYLNKKDPVLDYILEH